MKNYFFLTTAFLLFSCNNSPQTESDSSTNKEVAQEATEQVMGEPESAAGLVSSEASSDRSKPEDKTKADLTTTSPKLIKNGYLTIEVKDYKESRKKIKDLVTKNGGYLGNESESNETYRITNELTIRIPAKTFDQMMEGLMAEGLKTDSKRIEVQDVGEEYADLTARIEAKKAVEKRYLEILNKANKISDILEIEEKLRVIREETEAAQGRIKYLESQVSYSTIHLSFYKTLDAHYTPPSGPGFFSRIWKGFVKGWENVLNFIIGLAYLWPLWLLIAIIWIWIKKRHIKIWPFTKKQI